MPANFYVIVVAQFLVWAMALIPHRKQGGWLVHATCAVWLGVVLGVLFDTTLGMSGVFAYFPTDSPEQAVSPTDLPALVLLTNAVVSYGLAVGTVGFFAKRFVSDAKGTVEANSLLLVILTLGVIGITFSDAGSIAMMFCWGMTIISIGELVLVIQQKSGPIAQLFSGASLYPFLFLWGLSIAMGLTYEAINLLYPFWHWLPGSSQSRVLVEVLVVFLGYFVLCHPIAVFWVSCENRIAPFLSVKAWTRHLGGKARDDDTHLLKDSFYKQNTEAAERYFDAVREYCHFQWTALSSTQEVLTKGVTVYIVIFGGLTGFLFSGVADLPDHMRQGVIRAGLIVSLIASVTGLAMLVGYLLGLRDLRDSYRILNARAFHDTKVELFINRGIIAVLFIGLGCAALIVLFSVLLWQAITE